MIKNLGNTDREMLATYGEMVEGMKPGADPKHLASIQPERNILAKYFGGTAPPAKPKPEDKWILRGAGDHIRQLHCDSGSQPKVVHGNANGAAWSRAKNRLTIGPNFSDLSVQEQARAIEWALILSDPGIPAKRRAGYLELIDHESHDYSATEG
jgi:hypothetical protein